MEPLEAEECKEENCLIRRRQVLDLQEEVQYLCESQEDLSEAKERLEVTVTGLKCTVNSQKAEIAGLQKHEERFNEDFSSLNKKYSDCQQMLHTEKQERKYSQDEVRYLLDVNAHHVAQIQRLEAPETPEGRDKSPCFDIETVEQQCPSSAHPHVLADSTKEEDDESMGSACSNNDPPGENMADILRGYSDIETEEGLGLDTEFDNMELDSYGTRWRTSSIGRCERRSSIEFEEDKKPYVEKGEEPKFRRRSADDTEEMPRSTTGATANSPPSHQAITDTTEAKHPAGVARTQAAMPESTETDCHRELQTEYSTYTRLSRIHVHTNRPELINTLSVMVRHDDHGLQTSAIIRIIDKSRAGCPPTTVVIDKPLADVFPSINPGECILLKNFKVSWSRQVYLNSHTNSEWCIWRSIDDYDFIGQSLVFGLEETAEMERLRHWWQSQRDARGRCLPPFC